MEGSSIDDGFGKLLRQASDEYSQLFKRDLRYIKKTEDRVSAANMCFMRARDIAREQDKSEERQFTFTITTFDLENRKWDKCPGCGDPDINKESVTGKTWQGCYSCRVLLGSNGMIKSMDSSKGGK